MSDSLSERKDQLCRAIKYSKKKPKVFVVIDSDRPEFFPAKYLKQDYYSEKPLKIIGITDTYEDALLYLAVVAAGKMNFIKD